MSDLAKVLKDFSNDIGESFIEIYLNDVNIKSSH